MGPSWLSCIQWNLSIEDTIGTQLAVRGVPNSEVDSYVVGTADSVFIREVSFIESVHGFRCSSACLYLPNTQESLHVCMSCMHCTYVLLEVWVVVENEEG